MNLVLLRIACPEFSFSCCLRRPRLRWVAVRKDSARKGMHTVVTGDLDELQAALADALAGSPKDVLACTAVAFRSQVSAPRQASTRLARAPGRRR